jgi:HEPN domain-containing protein
MHLSQGAHAQLGMGVNGLMVRCSLVRIPRPDVVDGEEFDRWRAEAARAFRSAELQLGDGLFNWASFSAEQAAQLALKALLHGVGAAPWGHDLDQLAGKARGQGFDLPESVADAHRRLGRLYIPSRYPDAHAAGDAASHFARPDAEAAMEDARAVLEWVDSQWRGLA